MFAKPAFRVFSTHRGVLKVGAVYKQFLEKRIITGHAAKAVIFNTFSSSFLLSLEMRLLRELKINTVSSQ